MSDWIAQLELSFAFRGEKTVLQHWRHEGPLLVQRPFYPEGDICHIYLVHPPAGVAGGDKLKIDIKMAEQSHALITTPGATKFYRCLPQSEAQSYQCFTVANSATLEFLPQDSIFFIGTDAKLKTDIYLNKHSQLYAWETLCFARPMLKERFAEGRIWSRYHIYMEGRQVLRDSLRIAEGKLSALGEQPLFASSYIYPANESMLEQARTILDEYELKTQHPQGATLVDNILVIRLLGDDNEIVQHYLRELWHVLRPILTQRKAVTPRIWMT